MRRWSYILLWIVSSFSCQLVGCGSASTDNDRGDDTVLVAVGDSTLRLREVLRQIPGGLNEEDSIAMFHSIVDAWVRDLALIDFAEKNIADISEIDRMVETYRNQLIVAKYLGAMSAQVSDNLSESRIKEYYEANKEEMLLDQPLIKGGFLKISSDDPSIDKVKIWMQQFSDASIDKIEKSALRHASQYDYFKDEWHEWNMVADLIPYKFYDADAFVKSTKNFDTEEEGSVYILHISDYVASGNVMPYDYAKRKIEEILKAEDLKNFRKSLISDIYQRQIKAGILKPGSYDPVTGKMRD